MEKLYRTYRDNTYRVCLAVTRDPALAEEAVQQCWEGVLRRAARGPLPEGDGLVGYLITAARHAALDVLAKERDDLPLEAGGDAPAPDDTEGAARYRELVARIRALPENYREILEMKFVLEYDNRAIARRTGLTPGAVAGRLRRGRALLAAAREEFGAVWAGGEAMDPTPGFGAWETDFLARRAAPARAPRRWGRILLVAAAVLAVLVICTAAAAHIYLMNVRLTDLDDPAFPQATQAELPDGGQQWLVEMGEPNYEETRELPLYEPSWLPDGAEKTRDNLYQGRAVHETVILEYRVGTEDSILFTYSRYQNFHGPAEDYTCQETRVAGKPGYLLWSVIDGREDRSSGTLLWYDQDEEMAFGLTYHSAENDVKNELFRIAKSISKIPGSE